jgi:hypothetical protein
MHQGGKPYMPNVLRRAAMTAATVAAASLSLIAPATAHASTTAGYTVSNNWAGYYSVSEHPVTTANAAFTIPTNISCRNSKGTPYDLDGYYGYWAALWVGTGGIANGGPLEQAGVDVYCRYLGAKPQFKAFWEVVGVPHVNNAQHVLSWSISAGDSIDVYVSSPAESPKPHEWYFQVDDNRPGKAQVQWRGYASLPLTLSVHTAEAITELPAYIDGDGSGSVDVGQVHYSYAGYTDTTGNDYRITDTPVRLYYRGKLQVYPGPASTSVCASCGLFTTYYTQGWSI